MHTILLNAAECRDTRDVHLRLKVLLTLPDYYGMNADALYDCLSEQGETVQLWIAGQAAGEAVEALARCIQVIEDLGGTARKL